MGILLSVKHAPKSLIDILTLWILCSVWPGILPGGIVFIASHKILLSLGISVAIGLIATLYIWKHPNEFHQEEAGTDST